MRSSFFFVIFIADYFTCKLEDKAYTISNKLAHDEISTPLTMQNAGVMTEVCGIIFFGK